MKHCLRLLVSKGAIYCRAWINRVTSTRGQLAASIMFVLFIHKWAQFTNPNFHQKLRHGLGEGNGTPLQYSCLENPMDGGAWWAAVHGIAKSWTRLSDFTFTFHFSALEKEMATHSSVLAWRIPGAAEPSGLQSMGSQSRTRLRRLSKSIFWLLWIMLQWKWKCAYLIEILFSILFGEIPRNGIAGLYVSFIFNFFWGISILF